MPAKLGDIVLDFVEREKVTESSRVSNKELENREVVTDIVTNDPLSLNITGELKEDAAEKACVKRGQTRQVPLLVWQLSI